MSEVGRETFVEKMEAEVEEEEHQGNHTSSITPDSSESDGSRSAKRARNLGQCGEPCTVSEVLSKDCDAMTNDEKMELKQRGRHTPAVHFDGKRQCRLHEHYANFKWMCGCSERKALFCFPCLIFRQNENIQWTQGGMKDIRNLTSNSNKHARSEKHLAAITALSLLGKMKTEEAFSESGRLSRHNYNFKVSMNREMLKHHVRALLFLVSQGLALRDHETKEGANRGNYIELVEEFSRFSGNQRVVQALEEGNPAFSGLSQDIQNDIVECMYIHLMQEIKSRVQNAPCVAIMADETTDVSNASQLALSVRLVYEGNVYEHLIDVVDMSGDRTVTGRAAQIKYSLNSCVGIDEGTNVIGQSYDRATGRQSLHMILQKTWPRASFVHCYAHKWAFVVRRVCDNMSTVSLFFGFIQSLCNFFRASPERASLLSHIIPGLCPTRWLTEGKSVTTVEKKFAQIEKVLQNIASGNSVYAPMTKSEASGLLFQMRQRNNFFLLKVFKRIFCLSDVMTGLLQERDIDAISVSRKIEDYLNLLKNMRSEATFSEIWMEVKAFDLRMPEQHNPPEDELEGQGKLKALLFEILDTLCKEILSRFEDVEKFQWMSLLHPDNFDKMRNDPQRIRLLISGAKSTCPSMVPESEVFYSQLKILYWDRQVQEATKEAHDFATLLQVLYSLDLTSALPDLSNALIFCATSAITNVGCDKSFSVFKRVKKYCRSTVGFGRTKHLMLLRVESQLLKELSKDVTFCDRIIDMFASMKQRNINLIYKQ